MYLTGRAVVSWEGCSSLVELLPDTWLTLSLVPDSGRRWGRGVCSILSFSTNLEVPEKTESQLKMASLSTGLWTYLRDIVFIAS